MRGGPEVDRQIVVLDQFSRNAYRDSPLSYAQDEKALELAGEGIEAGMDLGLRPMERDFFWMPIVHSEDVSLHRRHVEGLAGEARPQLRPFYEFRLSQAKAGVELMERFGRYPHRNEVLGRTSAPEELEYLRTGTPLHLREPPPPEP